MLISPAKSLDFKSEIGSFKCTQPKFLSKTQIINSFLKEKTPNDLKKIQNNFFVNIIILSTIIWTYSIL